MSTRRRIKTPTCVETGDLCVACWREMQKRLYYVRHGEAVKARQRLRYAAESPEVRSRSKVRQQKRRDSEPHHHRNSRVWSTTGHTLETIKLQFAEQLERCAVCAMVLMYDPSKPRGPTKTVAVADHDHELQTPRGVLCFGCNTKMGAIDSPLLPKLLEYKAYWDAVAGKGV